MTQNNPFADAFKDSFKAFGDWSAFSNPKTPAFDFSNLLQAQRRNAEAISAVNQVLTESIQAIVRRQAEILQSNATEALQLAKDVASSPNPEATVATQTVYAKSAFENALSNTREMAEIVSKSSIEVFDVLSRKMSDNIAESLHSTKKKAA